MKECPQCLTTYTDETLAYCLADGTALRPMAAEDPTVIRRTVSAEPEAGASGGGKGLKVMIGLLIMAILVFSGIVIAAAALFYYSSRPPANDRTSVQQPAVTATPTVDAVNKRTPTPGASPSPSPAAPMPKDRATPSADVSRPTATINSPGDGFLAMRSEPDTESGERVMKIPHAATVYLENCETTFKNVAGKRGRWCMVSYKEKMGWVFDAWLIYGQ